MLLSPFARIVSLTVRIVMANPGHVNRKIRLPRSRKNWLRSADKGAAGLPGKKAQPAWPTVLIKYLF